MADRFQVEIEVDDKGTQKLHAFGRLATKTAQEVSGGARQHGAMFARSWDSALGSVGGAFKSLGRIVTSFQGILIGVAGVAGIGMLTKSFIGAASTSEGLRIRLQHLLGDVEEGNRLFKEMADYAGRVPFQFEEVMQAATTLSGVMKGGVNQIAAWMPMIGDLAAVTGLNIQDTTGQVVRMFSAGAGAADMFRERGVLAMMGFKAGATYSAEETRKMMWESWQKMGSQFRGATEDLGESWTGLMSMMSDWWFKFRNMVMESGPFERLKDKINDLLGATKKLETEGTLEDWAKIVGQMMADIIESVSAAVGWFFKLYDAMFKVTDAAKIKELKEDIADLKKELAGLGEIQGDPIGTALFGESIGKKQADKRTQIEIEIQYLEGELKKLTNNVKESGKEAVKDTAKAVTDMTTIMGDTVAEEDKAIAKKRVDLQKQTRDSVMELTLDELDYKKWALDQEYEERKKILGKSLDLEKWYQESKQEIVTGYLDKFYDDLEKSYEDEKKITEELTDRIKELTLDKYDYEIYQIDRKYEKLQEIYDDEVKLTEWKNQELIDIEKRRLEEMTKKQEEAAEKWVDAISGFFDSIVGAGKDLEGWWKGWLDRLKGWLFKTIGEMVARWILGVGTMSANGPTMAMGGVSGGGFLSAIPGIGNASTGGIGGGSFLSGLGNIFGGLSTSINNLGNNITAFSYNTLGLNKDISEFLGSGYGMAGLGGLLTGIMTGDWAKGGMQAAGGMAGFAIGGPIGGILGSIGGSLLSGLFTDKSQRREMRRQKRVDILSDFYQQLGKGTSLEDFYGTMTNYEDKYYGQKTGQKMPFYPKFGWGGEWEHSLWRYGGFKEEGVPADPDFRDTVGQLDDFLGSLYKTMEDGTTVTAETAKVFDDYRGAIDKLNELMPTWGEQSQAWGEAMLALYSNLQAMALDKLLDQYIEKTSTWAEVLHALVAVGLTPLENSALIISKLLTPLLDDIAIGTDQFFEMYQIINMNTKALSGYQIAADRMTTIQAILTSGVELTNEQLVDLVTYYRLLKDLLEGNIVSVDDLNAAWEEARGTFEDLAGTITDVTQALGAWQSMVTSIQAQILGYQISTANPQTGVERLAILRQQITEATGGMPTTTYLQSLGSDTQRLSAVSNLQGLWDAYLNLAQEVYQRPSTEYQDIYESTIAELRKLEEFSSTQVSIYEVQVEQLDYLRMIAENTAALNSIPEYQHGGYVPKTGLAVVHQGEQVIPTGEGLTVNITVNESKSPQATGQAVSRELMAMLRSGPSRKLIQEIARRQ